MLWETFIGPTGTFMSPMGIFTGPIGIFTGPIGVMSWHTSVYIPLARCQAKLDTAPLWHSGMIVRPVTSL